MTDIIMFLFNTVNKFFELLKTFEFELFGFQVNILHIFLSFIVITMLIGFLRFGFSFATTEITTESIRHRLHYNDNLEKNISRSSSHASSEKSSVFEKFRNLFYRRKH